MNAPPHQPPSRQWLRDLPILAWMTIVLALYINAMTSAISFPPLHP
ncbi:hypothetical protein Isop_0979 [Isosphaera pallida ATCC 43644]|uniref:Uncharacterized protein n=1 Tax=Isosphaera pallida (strain ATCC 43644 / DSM 9630 / IS1B) TaxID=575540 RepID=E8R3K1_ISOPI|nr:hypothetical protein [Isosphaera pallida]ADV61568.1 hypothetical protein Isop_0979 [Isosphaera pallida ATCC 43644]